MLGHLPKQLTKALEWQDSYFCFLPHSYTFKDTLKVFFLSQGQNGLLGSCLRDAAAATTAAATIHNCYCFSLSPQSLKTFHRNQTLHFSHLETLKVFYPLSFSEARLRNLEVSPRITFSLVSAPSAMWFSPPKFSSALRSPTAFSDCQNQSTSLGLYFV